MSKLKTMNIKLPKLNLTKLDWSKWNFRKFNWLTIMSAMSYLYVLVFIPLIFGRKSSFASFHARQGFLLLGLWILFGFTFFLPVLPWIFAIFIAVCIIWGIINVISGQEKPLPWIGKLAANNG